MDLDTTLVLMLLGAGLVAVVATALELSPWWMFTLASGAGAVILVFAAQELSESCWSGPATGTDGRLFGILTVVSLVLYAAAALRAVIDGVQLSKAGDRDAAVSRYFACPLASILAGGVVFYAVLAAALHCIN
jgi:hypothetical protein